MSRHISRANSRGAVLALVSFGIFASHDVIVKFLGGSYAPFQIIFFSVLFGFPLVTLMLMRDRTDGNLRPRHPWWTALRTCAVVTTGGSAYYAFSTLPLTQTYAILFATPLFITVLAIPILGEKVRLRRWMAVIVGLAGVMVVLRPGGGAEMELGHLAAMTAAVGGSFSSIVMRKIGAEERSAVMLLYPMMANFVVMACILPFVYVPMPVEHLGLIGILALFSFVGGLIMIRAYREGEAVIVAPMQYSQILWAAGFGFLIFGEMPDWNTAVGAAIIIASGLYIVMREGRGTSSGTKPVLGTMNQRADTGTQPRIGLMAKLPSKAP